MAAKLPDDCKTLAQVRVEIDRLDRAILKLLAERSGYVRQAGVLKDTREAIVDKERIETIIGQMRDMAREEGLDPEIAEDFWRHMIGRFIEFEREEYDKLHGQD